MASAEFDEDSEEKRPTVQVGDPFTEKLLLEACLELMATDAIVAIQDMGAAGLTSSSVEMAAKGGLGIELDLDKVPVRETGMTAYEIMLSESQERMLMVLKPQARSKARAIFEKWELDFAVIGRLTDTGQLVLRKNGKVEADMPVAPLVDEGAGLSSARGCRAEAAGRPRSARRCPRRAICWRALRTLIGSPDLASQALDLGAVRSPGHGRHGAAPGRRCRGGARPGHERQGAGDHHRLHAALLHADPKIGGAQAVAETWRNLTAVGATPLAITDNLNFGNPAAARDHGPVRRLHRRHGRGLPGARLPGRLRQRLALQRDQRQGHPADAR